MIWDQKNNLLLLTYEKSWSDHCPRSRRQDVGRGQHERVEEAAGADRHEEEVGQTSAAHLNKIFKSMLRSKTF